MIPDLVEPELEHRLRAVVREMVPKLAAPDGLPAAARTAPSPAPRRLRWRPLAAAAVAAATVAGLVSLGASPAGRVGSVATAPPVGAAAWHWAALDTGGVVRSGLDPVGRLPDGRIVFVPSNAPDAVQSTALTFFDPASGRWSTSHLVNVNLGMAGRYVVGGLVVINEGTPQCANRYVVYDPATDSWAAPPSLTSADCVFAWGMHGRTLAVAAGAGDLTATTFWVKRWTIGDADWSTGAPAPLSPRNMVGSTMGQAGLVIYGGMTDRPTTATRTLPDGVANRAEGALQLGQPFDRLGLIDGATYDIAADRWTMLPTSPLPGLSAPLVWLSGDALIVSGGQSTRVFTGSSMLAARYTPALGWEMLPGGTEQAISGEIGRDDRGGWALTGTGVYRLSESTGWHLLAPGETSGRMAVLRPLGDDHFLQYDLASAAPHAKLVTPAGVVPLPSVPWDPGTETNPAGVWTDRGGLFVAPDGSAWLLTDR